LIGIVVPPQLGFSWGRPNGSNCTARMQYCKLKNGTTTDVSAAEAEK
jgi:hypothetical protein